MAQAIPTASHPAGLPMSGIARQQEIENALSMALFYVRQSAPTPDALRSATARANRALSLLKHASESAGTQEG